jgi:hypothetical protein
MKKINIKALTILAAASLALTSCDDLFEPAIENNLGVDYMYNNAGYAEGVLGNAYTRIPCGSFPFSEVATDDAVSNDTGNDWRKLAGGEWTSEKNKTERWRDCRAAIMYINMFLARAEKVHWADDEIASKMFCDREKGEAYGLRAMYMYYLLQAHGGMTADGQLMGVPIITEEEDVHSEHNLPRNTFADCMKAIYDDCQKAIELLPSEYKDIETDDEVPAKYKEIGATKGQFNRVFGLIFRGRVNATIVQAFRSKAALLAASPAFQASGAKYEDAANYAAEVLDKIGGVEGMDPTGWTWYANTKEINGLANGECPKEVLWRGEKSENNDWEKDNFAPSLEGNGRINPTQNFVDAFPMANGMPITEDGSGYKADDPYANRDPRLAAYVLYNGCKEGVNDTEINTTVDGGTKDGINKEVGKSTRTGYYLRKLLRQDVNLDPNKTTKQHHYTPRIRYTELFLNYAEAANEAWGPTGKGSHNYSAYDVIKALHKRAGVGNEYLESIKTNKEKMRELIRNERRIELSFEGFRFWDIRRWNLVDEMKAEVYGMSISTVDGEKKYTVVPVDTRNYKDYMIYGPIPNTEMLKFDQLQQNMGW